MLWEKNGPSKGMFSGYNPNISAYFVWKSPPPGGVGAYGK